MKKLVFTIGICLVATICFGQKKNVTDALRLAKDAKANFAEARTKIKAALQHDETKNDAKTWFTAGQIENLQFDKENTKLIIGQQPNEPVMYTALFDIYPYFSKAYELDLLPDAKGKVKPKYTKDMKSIMKANLIYYINGGVYYFDNNNHQKAYEFFDQYVMVSNSALMKDGEPVNVTAPVDSNYIYAIYYTAIAAASLDHEIAIKAMTRASKQEYKQYDAFLLLTQAYLEAGDNENFKKTLIDGISLFPTDAFFLQHLVMVYIDAEEHDKALEYTLRAIQNDQENASLYNVAGFIYERIKNDNKAIEYYAKSIALNGEDAETLSNLGRIYFNQGVVQLEIANDIADVRKYHEEKEKAKELFRKALPFYEKSFQLNPTPMDTKIALRGIYYNLEMGDKFDEIDKLMEQ